MSTLCEFVSDRKASQIKKAINTFIRIDAVLDDEALSIVADCDINLIRLHKLVASIKQDMLFFIDSNDEIECYINSNPSKHEGYVLTNEYGTYKIVDREVFSRQNFQLPKTWSK
jgi:hypothetical protein